MYQRFGNWGSPFPILISGKITRPAGGNIPNRFGKNLNALLTETDLVIKNDWKYGEGQKNEGDGYELR